MMTLTVLVHEAEEGGYWAEVPELPGCLTQGETLDELRANLQDAIESWIEFAIEDGSFEIVPSAAKWEIPFPDILARIPA